MSISHFLQDFQNSASSPTWLGKPKNTQPPISREINWPLHPHHTNCWCLGQEFSISSLPGWAKHCKNPKRTEKEQSRRLCLVQT